MSLALHLCSHEGVSSGGIAARDNWLRGLSGRSEVDSWRSLRGRGLSWRHRVSDWNSRRGERLHNNVRVGVQRRLGRLRGRRGWRRGFVPVPVARTRGLGPFNIRLIARARRRRKRRDGPRVRPWWWVGRHLHLVSVHRLASNRTVHWRRTRDLLRHQSVHWRRERHLMRQRSVHRWRARGALHGCRSRACQWNLIRRHIGYNKINFDNKTHK